MFKVDLSTAFFIYLALFLGIIVGSNILLILKRRVKEKPASLKKNVYRCPICSYVYLFNTDDELSQCPRCKSFNKRTK